MLKILSIKVSGYKLLKDNFEINFVNKARVNKEELETEVLQIDENLYTFRNFAFVGANSSGKSTILSLILEVGIFLQTGRWQYNPLEFKNDKITLKISFYLNDYLYSYETSFKKIDAGKMTISGIYLPIENEKLKKIKYDANKGRTALIQLEESKTYDNSLLEKSLYDTSAISILTKNEIIVDQFNTNSVVNFTESIVRNSFFELLPECDKKLSTSIIQLLDNSIEYIIYNNENNIRFKRFGEDEKIVTSTNLILMLSAGTLRGVELYIRAIEALKFGKIFIVDEIENCFQKNLVYNLMFLFNNEEINKKGAQLFFSTHYIEILDYLNRRDEIFITHKINGKIDAKNLYSDYNVRTELLKSKQFDNNVFDTNLNYNQLMTVRKYIIDELYSNNE